VDELDDPEQMTARARNIVVGFDGTDAGRRALTVAADLVGYGSTLAVVALRTPESNGSAAAAAREQLQRRHVEARYLETEGEPGEGLVEKASELDADLLVIGRGSGRPHERRPDAVTAHVLSCAPCDVLVVR
jgi:nucleotide-binding universal stress UspA family protein